MDLVFSNDTEGGNESDPYSKTTSPLINDWGPKRDPLHVVIPVTLLYILIFITGVLGNISTCFVISRNKGMHTATNYYLFSLAISDLLLLICGLPPEIYSIWSKYPYIFGEAFCVLQGFAAETSANATVLTITAFTVERYVAICHPFLSHTMSKLSRAIKFVIAIWIVAMCLAIPQAMSFGIIYTLEDGTAVNEEYYTCNVKRTVIPHSFGISTLLFFVAPMTLITVLYILIGLQLHKSTVGPSRGNSVKLKHRVYKPVVAYTPSSTQAVLVINSTNSENVQLSNDEDGRKNFARNAQATKHVVKMLVAVVVAFFICWAPFHAQRLLAIYGPRTSNMVTAFRILTYISGILYYLSTSVNPFLYHIMSHKFREAFKDTFKNVFGRRRHKKSKQCYSTLSGRSSQINSHSNTDSCSRKSSLRYLEAEMAKLQDSKRPLVVSFKRKKSQYTKRPKHVTILDAELQEALNNLQEDPNRRDLFETKRSGTPSPKYEKAASEGADSATTFPFVEVHQLEPTHHCPVYGRQRAQRMHKEHRRRDRHKHRNNLTKSRTMPHMDEENLTIPQSKSVQDERSSSCSQLEYSLGPPKNIVIQVT